MTAEVQWGVLIVLGTGRLAALDRWLTYTQ